MFDSKKYIVISMSVVLSSYLYAVECNKTPDGSWIVENSNASGGFSLSKCIMKAQSDGVASKIVFDGDYTINFTEDINITDEADLTIDGGDHSIILDGAQNSRIFNITNQSKTTLQNLTLRNGTNFDGGAIKANYADIDIKNCTLSGNHSNYGGAMYVQYSELNVSDSTITSNTASEYGGGIDTYKSAVSINNSTITLNTADGEGGGLDNYTSVMVINNSTISSNSAGNSGGGISNLNESNITVNDSVISSNTAVKGGGIYASQINGGENLASININNSSIHDNNATYGGGVYADDGNITVSITNSSIHDNNATHSGSDRTGGGIFATSIKTLSINSSTVYNNSGENGFGGGVSIAYSDTLSLENSTISGNMASSGGGIYALDMNLTSILSSTIINNTATNNAGGIYSYNHKDSYYTNISNSIIAGNHASVENVNNADANKLISSGYNLLGHIIDQSTEATDIMVTGSPLLEPLADNGGPTKTHALQKDSLAIDAGYTTLTTDQRGEARDSSPDIGAYEYKGNSTLVPIMTYLLF